MKVSPDLVAAGQTAAAVHQQIGTIIKPGLNLLEIEKKIGNLIAEAGMKPAFQGYKGYPAASCLSVNSVIVHGIPYDYALKEGDVISVDLGVEKNGWIVDTAVTHPVGQVSADVDRLLKTTQRSLDAAVQKARAGLRVGDIGQVVQQIVEKDGFYIVKELTGHGVGTELQMPPSIPNYGLAGNGPEIKAGMVLAIEPITALTPVEATIGADHWTISASPNAVCAHFEHTIFVTDDEPIILTALV